MPWILDTGLGNIRLGLEGGYLNEHNPIDSHSFSGFVTDAPEELIPFRITISQAPDPLPEFASYCYGDIYVGETARKIIEEFEPGQHQFYDTIVTRKGKPVTDRSYFRFRLGEASIVDNGLVLAGSDVVVRDRTIKRRDGSVVKLSGLLPKARPTRLIWDREIVQDRHLWTERKLRGFLLASDELYAAFKAAGVTGFNALESRFSEDVHPEDLRVGGRAENHTKVQ